MATWAKRVYENLKVYPELRKKLIDRGYSSPFLNRIERVGAGVILPELLLESGSQYRALESLPPAEQREVYDSGVDVLQIDGKEPRRIPIEALTPQQVRQVFSNGRIRSLAEQRSWLQEHQARTRTPVDSDVRIFKDKVVVNGFVIHRQTLLDWIRQM